MELYKHTIPKVLRSIRRQKKLKQKTIAHLSSLTQSELSNFENQVVDIRLSTLERIAEALDMKIIAVPKNKLKDIDMLCELEKIEKRSNERPLTLLEKYEIKDEE